MCILISTTEHPDYPFLLLSNRDEYYARPTKGAHFRTLENGTQILAPLDLARTEHGTWIGVTTSGKIAVLVNYREEDNTPELGEISRGILPLDYLSSISSDEDWYQNLENELAKKSIRDTKVSLRKIGGFSLLYGKLDINHNTGKINHLNILSNRGDRGRVHDSMLAGACPTDEELKSHEDVAYQTTFGLSNSLFYKPWQKVDIGKSRLEELVSKSIVENYTHDELIQHCFDDILSYNTFDAEAADKAQTLEDKFLELRKSIFIPPLKTGVSKPLKSSFVGSYYGTRTQTVIALHKSGVLHYYEHDIHDSDESSKEFKVKKQHFQIPLSVPQ